jgi:plastocyanin
MMTLRRRQTWCWLLVIIVATVVRARAQEASVTGRVELFSTESAKKATNASSVVMWLVPASGAPAVTRQSDSSQPQGLRLVQKEKSFHPHLLVVEVGARVEFPNHDPFFHNVFSLFEGKRFDLGLYEAGTSHIVHFDRVGVSYIFCNIHPEMSAVVLALNTPLFGISDSTGNVAIPAVPPGRYILRVWYERAMPDTLKSLSREVTISQHSHSLGLVRVAETSAMNLAHKNKYGQDYVPPSPSSPAYPRP